MDYDLNSYHSCKALNLRVFCWSLRTPKVIIPRKHWLIGPESCLQAAVGREIGMADPVARLCCARKVQRGWKNYCTFILALLGQIST